MKEEPLMLLSMKDSKAVANAMSNETAQKIISYLAENKEATESQLSEKLKVPLPTIHYNIQQLKKARLIEAKEFFWSKKGKEMLVYKLAKKYIIISPDTTESSLSKLKNLLPVTLLSLIGSGIIYLYQNILVFNRAAEVGKESIGNARGVTEKAVSDTAFAQISNISQHINTFQEPNYAIWFLIGSLFVIMLMFLFSLRKK
jgi:DNA-binding transcriptional ArsR family regulator